MTNKKKSIMSFPKKEYFWEVFYKEYISIYNKGIYMGSWGLENDYRLYEAYK